MRTSIEQHGFISFALTRWKRLDIKRAKGGTHRSVYLVGSYALKFPVLTEWRLFLCGLLANMQEITFSRTRHPRLCSVMRHIPGGWLNVMLKGEPLSDEEWARFNFEEFIRVKDANGNDWVLPVEDKRDSFAKINGEIVAVDYGS